MRHEKETRDNNAGRSIDEEERRVFDGKRSNEMTSRRASSLIKCVMAHINRSLVHFGEFRSTLGLLYLTRGFLSTLEFVIIEISQSRRILRLVK